MAMSDDYNVQRIIRAAVAYTEVAERHMKHEKEITALLQEGAKLAKNGQHAEAKQKQRLADEKRINVFNYEDVHKELIEACKPFRGNHGKER